MSDSENLLASAYHEQAQLYAGALGIMDRLTDALQQGSAGQTEIHELAARLEEIRRLDTAISDARATWKQTQRAAGPHLAKAMQQVIELIEKLSSRLQLVERLAQSRRERVTNDLEGLARGMTMQRAYETARAFANADARS